MTAPGLCAPLAPNLAVGGVGIARVTAPLPWGRRPGEPGFPGPAKTPLLLV